MKIEDVIHVIYLSLVALACTLLMLLVARVADAQDCDPCVLGCPGVCEDFIPTPGCFIPGAECGDERVFIDCDFPRETLDALYGKHVGFLCDDANLLFEEANRYLLRSERKTRKIRRLRRRLQQCER